MKKPKFLFKIDHDLKGKVYINHKWIKDVHCIHFHGEPFEYSIYIQQYKRDAQGKYILNEDTKSIATKVKVYHLNREVIHVNYV